MASSDSAAAECRSRCEVATHAVHACARWRRRRTDVQPGERRAVRNESRSWTCKQLSERVCAPGDVAADEVRVLAFQVARIPRRAGENTLTEAGREAFDLSLDALAHVERRSVWNMAVHPGGVLTGGRARFVEHALLREQDKGAFRVPSFPRGPLRVGNLVERAAEVDCSRFCDFGRTPRDRPVECIVELERTRTVAPPLEPTSVAVWQQIAGERNELSRSHVAKHELAARQIAERRP